MYKRKHGDHIVTRCRTVERSPGPPPLHDLSRIPLRPQSGLLLQWEHNRLNSLPGNSQPPKWPLVHSMSSRFLPLLPLHRLLDSVFIALSFPPPPLPIPVFTSWLRPSYPASHFCWSCYCRCHDDVTPCDKHAWDSDMSPARECALWTALL